MKLITPHVHGYLDCGTVVLFLLAPKLFGFDGLPALVSWGLGGVHLVVTLVTDFPLGWYPLLPFWMHGWIERIVGPVLIVVAFLPRFSDDGPASAFYLLAGLAVTAVGALTDYSGAPPRSPGAMG
jgi:hypothetical protein